MLNMQNATSSRYIVNELRNGDECTYKRKATPYASTGENVEFIVCLVAAAAVVCAF